MTRIPVTDNREIVHVFHDHDGHLTSYRVEIPVERMTDGELFRLIDQIRDLWPVPSERPVRAVESLRRVKREVCARCERRTTA